MSEINCARNLTADKPAFIFHVRLSLKVKWMLLVGKHFDSMVLRTTKMWLPTLNVSRYLMVLSWGHRDWEPARNELVSLASG